MSGTLKIAGTTLATNPTNSKVEIDDAVNGKGIAKAWVNFDGTNAFNPNPSTTAIRDSFNITSVLDKGAGWYKANFSTNMSDTNYAVVGSAHPDDASNSYGGHFIIGRHSANRFFTPPLEVDGVTFTTCRNDQSTYTDSPFICLAIFGS